MSPETELRANATWHDGGCHCGAVRFRAFLPDDVMGTECNCSICAKSGYLHAIVAEENFRLVKGEDSLTSYRFHTKTAEHMFCTTCGIKSFYRPRSHPESWSVNLRCLDDQEFASIKFRAFDGRHWQKNIAQLNRQDRVQ